MTTTMDEAMNDARDAAAEPMDKVLERLGERIGAQANVKAVFGDPTERGDVTVVPVARVRWGYGGGSGTGPVRAGKSDDQTVANGTGMAAASWPTRWATSRSGRAGRTTYPSRRHT